MTLHVIRRSASTASAPRVVLVHGSLDRVGSFRALMTELTDFDVTAYDRRGCGRSVAAQPPAIGVSDHAEDLYELLDGRPATLIGHSFGGHIAGRVARRHPELVRSIGLYETSIFWAEWWSAEHAAIIGNAMRRSVPLRGDTAKQSIEVRTFATELRDVWAAPYTPKPFDVPALIGYGTKSEPYVRDGMARLGRETDAELFPIDGADHMAHREHPVGFAGFVRRTVELAL